MSPFYKSAGFPNIRGNLIFKIIESVNTKQKLVKHFCEKLVKHFYEKFMKLNGLFTLKVSIPKQGVNPNALIPCILVFRAVNGARTHDPQLGIRRLADYRLSPFNKVSVI
jgi:hypothetical protein